MSIISNKLTVDVNETGTSEDQATGEEENFQQIKIH